MKKSIIAVMIMMFCLQVGDAYAEEQITIRTEFESICKSTSQNAGCSGGKLGLAIAEGENVSLDISVIAPVDGKYLFEFSGNPPTTSANYESKYSITHNSQTCELTRKAKEYYYDIYETEVWLQEGENILTINMSKRSMDNYCVLYGDYYQITLLKGLENFVVEAESYTSRTFTPDKRTAEDQLSNDQMIVYNGGYDSAVCYIEYTFNADKAGWYELISRNSIFGEPWTTDFAVNVNGGERIYPGKFAKPLRSHTEYMADSNLIKEYSVGNFYLNAGQNKMRVYLDKDDPANSGKYTIFIDCFKFTETEFAFDRIITNNSCGAYEKGNNVVIDIKHTANAPEQKKYTYKVTDFYGNSYEGETTLQAGESSALVDLGTVDCGWYRFELYESGDLKSFVNFSVLPPYSERFTGETPFAVDFASSLLRNRDEFERQVRAAKLAGVGWMRERYSWKGLQYKEENSIYYGDINKSVKTLHDNGIKVNTILYDLPDWTSEDELFDIYTFQKNASENTDVDLWEILNETDGSRKTPADSYSAFYKAAALGNAAAKTPAKTSMASQCVEPDSFYNRLFMKNDLEYFSDIYNYHIHEALKENSSTRINVHSISEHIDTSKENGYRPFWITEAGTYIKTDNSGNTTDNQRKIQAQYCVTSTVESLAAGTDKHFWFVWPQYIENEQELGSFDKNMNPYPVYQAYGVMTHILGKGEYKGKLDIDGIYGYVFNAGNKEIAVVWADNNKKITLSAGDDIEITDIMGRTQNFAYSDGKVSVDVGTYPVYIPLDKANIEYIEEVRVKEVKDVPEFTSADKIVIKQCFEGQTGSDARMGYIVKNNETANMTVKIYNFNDQDKNVRLVGSLYGYKVAPEKETIIVPAMDYVTVKVSLVPDGETLPGEQLNLAFNCETDGMFSTPSVSYVIIEGANVSPAMIISGSDKASNWSKSSGGTMTITNTSEGVNFRSTFTDGSRWSYPIIKTYGIIAKNYDGISFMAKSDSDSVGAGYYNINCYLQDGTIYNLGNITGYTLKDDWIYVKATWDDFELYQNPNGHPLDTKLDPSKITYLKFGGNFYQDSVGYTLKNFGYIKAAGKGIEVLSAVIAGESVKVQAVNNQHDFGEYTLIVAEYDDNGRIVQVSEKTIENVAPIKTYDINIKMQNTSGKMKLFAWDDVNGLTPVNDAIILN